MDVNPSQHKKIEGKEGRNEIITCQSFHHIQDILLDNILFFIFIMEEIHSIICTLKTVLQRKDVVYNIRKIKNNCIFKGIKRKTEKHINTLTLF